MSDHLMPLAEFIATTRYLQLPAALTAKAGRHLLDTLGAGLAGVDSDIWRQCLALTLAEGGAHQATLWGSAQTVTPRQAAWLNGVAAHMYELDDSGGCDHSGAVVIPALLAALPLAGRPVSGSDLITAMVVGYDTGRRVLEACGGYEPHNGAGWHSTATCGVFGAAAAVCSLLQLPAAACASALGIAASFSGGIWAFIHDGSQTKKLHCGRAAEGGLQAALLAAKGIQGPAQVFDPVWGGFLQTIAPDSQQAGALTAELGQVWKLARCSVKPYASCRGAHSAVDALQQLLDAHPGVQVQQITVRLNPFLAGMCGGKALANLAAAQMSLPYALVALLLYQDAGLNSYSDQRRLAPEVAMWLEKIVLQVDDQQQQDEEPTIILHAESGERWQQQVTVPSGSPANPISDQQLLEKFHSLAGRALPEHHCQQIEAICLNMDSVADVSQLSRLLQPPV